MTILNRELSRAAVVSSNGGVLYKKAPLVVAMWALSHGVPLLAQDFTPTKFTDRTGTLDGSLRDAVIQVNADAATQDDRIVLAAGTYTLSLAGRTEDAFLGDLNITRAPIKGAITIIGVGPGVTIIDAASIDRAFNISGSTVTFKNLTIRNGVALDNGGASLVGSVGGGILNLNGNLTLDNVVLEQNSATGASGTAGAPSVPFGGNGGAGGSGANTYGGALYSSGGTLTITNSTIRNNQSKAGDGGAGGVGYSAGGFGGTGGQAEGGGICTTNTIVSISGSTLNGNVTTGGAGGAGGAGDGLASSNGSNGGQGGFAGGGLGGAFFSYGGTVTLTNSTVSSNSVSGGAGGAGGAGAAAGPLAQSPVRGLGGDGGGAGYLAGGGLYFQSNATGSILNSTIAMNSVALPSGGVGGVPQNGMAAGTAGAAGQSVGGGLFGFAAISSISTIYSNNTAVIGPDFSGNVTSQGFNLILSASGVTGFTQASDITGVDPQLGALQDNGGPTFTQALAAGSPAVDKGSAGVLTTDQRGGTFARVAGSAADIGAFEIQPPTVTPPAPPPPTPPVITSPPAAVPSPAITTQTVQFTVGGNGNVSWSYGDGTTGNGASTSHQYANPGTYTVTVTLTDPATGLSTTQTLTVTILGIPFRVSRATFKLVKGADVATVQGVLHIPRGVAVAGQTVVLSNRN